MRLYTLPTLPIVARPPHPRTVRETAELVRQRNLDERHRREERRAAHEAVMEDIRRSSAERERLERLERESGRRPANRRGHGVTINPASIYAERNRPRPDGESARPPAGTPRRPRSFGELARRVYGPPDAAGSLIGTTPRGGAQ